MPDLVGPFDASTFAQAQYFRDRGYLEPSGVQGTPAATAAAGDLGLTAAGFGLTMGLGRAHVRGAAYERTGTAFTTTTPANTSSAGPRRDLLVLRRDLTAKTVVPTYLQGTAAASPADPAVTQVEDGVWDLVLHRVQAPPSSGTPLVVTDLRTWIDPAGGGLIVKPSLLPVSGGWQHWRVANPGSPFEPLHISYTNREVRIRGALSSPAIGSGALSTVLPAGGIPAALRPVGAVPTRTTLINNGVTQRTDVNLDGSMTAGPTTTAIGSGAFCQFDFSYNLDNNPT